MFSKRDLLSVPLAGLMASTAGVSRPRADPGPTAGPGRVAAGPFNATVDSLRTYQTPEWFRDAKLGIWAHWGPQAVPRRGDWYARWMYVPGHPHYAHHLETYGHPSEAGYKDILPLWTAERFDPDALMDLYVAAGAKYFVSMGVHHDNFDLWNSGRRWSSVQMGPKRDIVGAWRDAARKRGLRFGVSEHLGASHNWWYPSHLYDQFWPRLGVPYDGADPAFSDLYHRSHDEPFRGSAESWYTNDPAFQQMWFERISQLIDDYQPDLLYSDGGIPFGETGRSLVAHLYNSSIARHGRLDAVYNCKDLGSGEFYKEACVQDVERGVMSGINPLPWQTDTSNGDWFHADDQVYKTGADVIRMLADIVSKNGNLLLNVVLYADGSLPPESQDLLKELADWMRINSEAIHGTRPWSVFGEGPTDIASGAFREDASYTPEDIRFTTAADTIYAITLGEPRGAVAIQSLGLSAGHETRRVGQVDLLGHGPRLSFRQTDTALVVDVPGRLPSRHSSVFRITVAA